MFDITTYFSHLDIIQLIAALLFVPLACWFHGIHSTIICRWSALASGYLIQIGLFLILDDVGFKSDLLILFATIAAYFWITTTTSFWHRRQMVALPIDES